MRRRQPFLRPTLLRPGLLAFAALVLVACGDEPTPPPPPPAVPPEAQLTPVGIEALPGWTDDHMVEALPALRRSCGKFLARTDTQTWIGPGAYGGTVGDWQGLCRELDRAVPPDQPADAVAFRAFVEARLQPYAVSDAGKGPEGTFTGYYESELAGCRDRSDGCTVPLYGMPDSLVTVDMGAQYPDMKGVRLVGRVVGDRIVPAPARAAIEDGVLDGEAPVVAWARDPVDVHILHIQGSGQVQLPDGDVLHVGYAGNNGHPFKGIGRIMLDEGLLAPGQASMPAIRAWLKEHPEEADRIMRQNPRFIFFRRISGDGPLGAMGVPLVPGRSIAVDTRYVPLGVPLWLDSVDPDGVPLHRLMVAQDVGSAIKGVVRGDFFWGPGEPALAKAGRMKSPGRWFLLLPKSRTPTT